MKTINKKGIKKLICLLFVGIYSLPNSNMLIAQTSQTPLCVNAQPFCSDASHPTFPNQTNTDIPIGPDYGCLDRIPGTNDVNEMVNPQWFYFQVSQSGSIELQVTQEDNSQNPIDLDFVMWGPFSDLTTGCNQVMNGIGPIQCSSDPSAQETIGLGLLGGGNYWANFPFGNFIDGTSTPPQANAGEVYIVMLTNADGQPGTISLEQTGGNGATDCNIITPCDITTTATPTACVSPGNTYSVSGVITFTDEPTTGTLIVEDCNGNSTTFSAPFTSPQNYTITGIPSNGLSCDITAYFSDAPTCSSTTTYQSPAPCNCTPPSITINDLTICASETADLANAVDPISDPATITYYNTQTDADNATNTTGGLVTNAGSYWIRAENPNDPTCYVVLEVQVSVTTVTYTASITDENCNGQDGIIDLTVTSGLSPYTYSIDNGISTQANGTFTGISAGVYQIEITDDNGCKGTGTEIVANIGGPTIDQLNFINPSCNGVCDGEIETTVSGGSLPYTYSWFNANGDPIGTNAASITGLCSGVYTVEISDAAGICPITSTITLTDPSLSDASFSLTNYCEGHANKAIITGDVGGTFSFNPSVNDGATIDSITGEISNGVGGTTYSVEYKTSGNCSISSTEQVTVYISPTAHFTADPIVSDLNATMVTFSNGSTHGDNYLWDFGDGSSTEFGFDVNHEYPDDLPGQYIVTLVTTTNLGCTDSTFKTITIAYPTAKYKIPNVFTPNGDKTNDVFKLIHPEHIADLNVSIQNRWGAIVFESNDIQFKWNGQVNNSGSLCTDGTYFYVIKIKTVNGNEDLKQGFVQLSRGH